MGWFKVDDQLAFNAKVMLAGNSAMGLWVRAGSWSSAQLTGGFVPAHMANAMANGMANPCDSDALVMAGLWNEAEGGFQFHDWAEFQPDAEVEKAKRKATSDARSRAGKAGAQARWAGKPDGKPMANASAENGKPMPPTRPDPTIKSVGDSRRKPERPLPADWAPNDTHKSYASTEGINLTFQAERFTNWAKAKDARYRDWDAAFRNWLLKAEKSQTNSPSPWDRKGIH